MDHINCENGTKDILDCKLSGWKPKTYCLESDALHISCANKIKDEYNGKAKGLFTFYCIVKYFYSKYFELDLAYYVKPDF